VPDVQKLDGRRLRVSARLPAEDLTELFPGLDRPPSTLTEVLEEAAVDTVGGLLAHQLGRVPLPGALTEVAGLRLIAEGGKDARGRVRINTVLVEPVEPPEHEEEQNGAGEPADRREESDVRPG
jgi:CBS domain containing-hemolysin-like protein